MSQPEKPIPPKPIDPKAFMGDSFKNLEKLRLAMQETPELFEALKHGVKSLCLIVDNLQTTKDEMRVLVEKIAEFYKRILKE